MKSTLPSSRDSETVEPPQTDVPMALLSEEDERAIGTQIDRWKKPRSLLTASPSTIDEKGQCANGIGTLMRDTRYKNKGRDAHLPCKVRSCSIYGPRGRSRKSSRIQEDFGDTPIHAVVLDAEEWEAFHKTHLDRGKADYHRIPAPDDKIVVLTNADLGEEIDEATVQVIIEMQPCDNRRMTSSRNFKGAGSTSTGRWKRVGTSRLAQKERLRVYDKFQCHPAEVPPDDPFFAGGFVTAHDLDLPPANTALMDRIGEELDLMNEKIELNEYRWPFSTEECGSTMGT